MLLLLGKFHMTESSTVLCTGAPGRGTALVDSRECCQISVTFCVASMLRSFRRARKTQEDCTRAALNGRNELEDKKTVVKALIARRGRLRSWLRVPTQSKRCGQCAPGGGAENGKMALHSADKEEPTCTSTDTFSSFSTCAPSSYSESAPDARPTLSLDELDLDDVDDVDTADLADPLHELLEDESLDLPEESRHTCEDLNSRGHDQSAGCEVILHVYDLHRVTRCARVPIFHTGIEVYGLELCYGSTGLVWCQPGNVSFHVHKQSVSLGWTGLSATEILQLSDTLRQEWSGDKYNIFNKNCQTFAVAFSDCLGVELPRRFVRFSRWGRSARNQGFKAS